MAIELENSKKHLVVKRSGKVEPYNPDKLYKVLLWAADGNEVIANSILEATKIRIYDRIPIALLYDEVMDTTYNLISRISPVYDKVLLNLYLQKMYKSSWNMTRNFYPSLPKVLKKFSDVGIIIDVTKHFTEDELITLSKAINPSRDKLSSYLGMSTFFSKYSKNYNGSYELLQHGFMRLAIQSYLLDESSTRVDKIISRYDNLSLGLYTEATPKWKNSLTFNMQGASCCVHKPDDNTESINKVTSDIGQYSRHDGGNAADVSAFRASGSTIGSKGVSSGPIPFIRKFQAAVEGFNQSGTRPGICIVTYQWWHADVMSLLLLLDEGGQENQRARNLKYTLKVNRLFLRAIESGSDVHLFDPKDVPELLNTWGTEFEDLYQQAIDNGLTKTVISARTIAYELAKQRSETGNIYIFFSDNANEQSTFNDTIHSSNACVTGDTKILTKEFGNVPISEVAGQTLECWDGKAFTATPLFQTNESAHVLRVKLSNGQEIEATDYHKWYTKPSYSKPEVMKRTHELVVGDKLVKFDVEPVTHGTKILQYAYEAGFLCADGTVLPTLDSIYLYNGKKDLVEHFKGYKAIATQNSSNASDPVRLCVQYSKGVLLGKFKVPSNEYSVSSRIAWLAGLLDGDGTITTVNKNEHTNGAQSIQITQVNLEFLRSVHLLLLELGVQSKIQVEVTPAGYHLLPVNNGTGESKEYWCQASHRLLIPGTQLGKLTALGIRFNRLKLDTEHVYQRQATKFVTVVAIVDEEKFEATYCGTSPETSKLVFNGVLTGNCTEIMLPTKASKFNKAKLSMSMSDCKFTTTTIEETGLTALCNLSSINVAAWDKLDTPDKHSLAKELLEGSDNLIEWQYYPTADGELFNRGFRAIGIGMNNLAYLFASKGLPFDSDEARELMKELSSSMRDVFVEESKLLAESRGSFQFFNKTSQTVPSRFATLFAIAPTSTSSLIINATEGIEPVSKLLAEKTGTYSTKQLAPELSSLGSKYSIAGDIPTKALYSLAAIRQECLGEMAQGQSVNTYMSNSDSAYDIISDIILAEELGLLSLYYLQSSTAIAEQCDSCGA